MKKTTMKLVMTLVVIALVAMTAVGLVACNTNTVKIGVLVADTTGAEANAFRSYYENYIAKEYNDVEFVYSSETKNAEGEMSALETFAAENCKAVISFSSYDRPAQIAKCAEYEMYYAVATGMLSEEDFEANKSNKYFLGQIGPDTMAEYSVGLAMGQYYKTKGVTTVALYVGFPDPAHVARLSGILTGLGMKYAGMGMSATGPIADLENPVDGMGIMGVVYAVDGGTANLNNIIAGDSGITVTQVLSGAGFGGPLDAMVNTLVSGTHPDVVIGVGMVSVFFASQLDTANIPYADVDAFTADNQAHFQNGKMEYLAGKYGSSVGPVFALVYNAIVHGNVIRDNGNAVSLSQGYLVAKSLTEFNTAYNNESGTNPIFNKTKLDTVIGAEVTLAQLQTLVAEN